MTCIVAIRSKEEGVTYMGSDSLGSNGWTGEMFSDKKVFRNGPFLLGVTGSFRMIQFLQYRWSPPKRHPDTSVDQFIYGEVIQSLRSQLKDEGYLKNKDGEEYIPGGSEFLMAYADQLFNVQVDLSATRIASEEYSVGSGYPIAMGSMRTSRDWVPDRDRCRIALQVAAELVVTVGGLITVKQLKHPDK